MKQLVLVGGVPPEARGPIASPVSAEELVWRGTHPFAGPWLPISSAPRDGRVIEVTDLDTCAADMWWNAEGTNPLVQAGAGIWEAIAGEFTWSEAAGHGPTHWRAVAAEMPAFLLQLNANYGR